MSSAPSMEPVHESRLQPRVKPRLEPKLKPRLEPRLKPRLEPRLESGDNWHFHPPTTSNQPRLPPKSMAISFADDV